jgi:hypothetical protein
MDVKRMMVTVSIQYHVPSLESFELLRIIIYTMTSYLEENNIHISSLVVIVLLSGMIKPYQMTSI